MPFLHDNETPLTFNMLIADRHANTHTHEHLIALIMLIIDVQRFPPKLISLPVLLHNSRPMCYSASHTSIGGYT